MDQSNKISFKGEALARKRKKLRLSQAMVANKLTLSIDQINAIEKNQDRGFINFHFKALSIKRYARLLEVDLKKIIIAKDDSTEAPAKNTPVSPRPFFKPFFTLIFLVFLLGVMMRIFIFDTSENIEDDLSIAALEKSIIAEMKPMENEDDTLPIIINDPEPKAKNTSDKNEEKLIPQNETIAAPIAAETESNYEFLCTIRNATTIEYTTKNPEKPATYFHLVSLEPQTICSIDDAGNFKTVELEKEGRVTIRGQAPFKIQLDPSKSRLFFQGWIVRVDPSHSFIQLNPSELPEPQN